MTITPESLRAIADDEGWYDGGTAMYDIRGVLREAADEIERLQSDVTELMSACNEALNDPKGLRDRFAMAALQGLIAMDTDATVKRMRDAGQEPIAVQCATAYKFADAMMKAREGK